MTAEERQLAEPWFAIIATGDGAETVVVPESALHQRLHDVYCACGFTWALCDDADTLKLISSLDDEDRWTHEYPARVRHIWSDHGEDYSVTVSRLTEPLAAEREKQELRRVLHLVDWHLGELREAWERGVISEHDGSGGTRSNRNAEVLTAVRGKQSAEDAITRMGVPVAEAEALLKEGKA